MRSLRSDLRTVIIAVVAATVTAGAPAVAHGVHAAFAHNADRVDNRHAVGAGASLAQAKGKLVTHNSQGRVSAKFIPTEFFNKVVYRFDDQTTANGSNGFAQADCLAGEVAVGGGSELRSGNIANMYFFGDDPVLDPTTNDPIGWKDSVYNNSGQSNDWRVYVICAS